MQYIYRKVIFLVLYKQIAALEMCRIILLKSLISAHFNREIKIQMAMERIQSYQQGSYSFEPFKFHDFPWLFPWPFQVFHDLRLSCRFRKFLKLSLFLPKAVQQTQALVSSVHQNVFRLPDWFVVLILRCPALFCHLQQLIYYTNL